MRCVSHFPGRRDVCHQSRGPENGLEILQFDAHFGDPTEDDGSVKELKGLVDGQLGRGSIFLENGRPVGRTAWRVTREKCEIRLSFSNRDFPPKYAPNVNKVQRCPVVQKMAVRRRHLSIFEERQAVFTELFALAPANHARHKAVRVQNDGVWCVRSSSDHHPEGLGACGGSSSSIVVVGRRQGVLFAHLVAFSYADVELFVQALHDHVFFVLHQLDAFGEVLLQDLLDGPVFGRHGSRC